MLVQRLAIDANALVFFARIMPVDAQQGLIVLQMPTITIGTEPVRQYYLIAKHFVFLATKKLVLLGSHSNCNISDRGRVHFQ